MNDHSWASGSGAREPIAEIPSTCAAVLLAAGSASRFAGPTHKLLAPLRGRTVIEWSFRAVMDAGFATIIVVNGPIPFDLEGPGVINVHNPLWESGQASSVRAGIAAAQGLQMTSVVVGLADQPFVTPEAWGRIARSTMAIAVATYVVSETDSMTGTGKTTKTRGNPVRLADSVWDLLPEEGDFGARNLISSRPELVEEVLCSGSPSDIDTIEDLRKWN